MSILEDRLLELRDKYDFVTKNLAKAVVKSFDLDPCRLIPIEECKKIKLRDYDCIKCRIEYFEEQYEIQRNHTL
jgi:hypothetical protein